MRTKNFRRITAVAACAAAISVISACSDANDSSSASSSTVTATVTESTNTPSSNAPAKDANNDGNSDTPAVNPKGDKNSNGGSGGGTQCQTPPGIGAQIEKGKSTIAPPLAGVGWDVEKTNFSSCNSLNWAVLDTQGGTASSPWQLLMFNRQGKFVGTGIRCNVPFQEVTGSTPDRVNVTYRYTQGNDANANPSGSAAVTFRWNGSGVVMDGTLPAAVTNGKC